MVPFLHPAQDFPPLHTALGQETEFAGLLCAGADLSVARLIEAYSSGIFPWFSDNQPILWWSTDPRMVLNLSEFRLHLSLKKRIRQLWQSGRLDIRVDHDVANVMRACGAALRPGQSGTWIVPAMREAYTQLARAGHVHSVEAWLDGELAGGLYCVAIGQAVFGESMFHRATDASKIALAALVALCSAQGVLSIDCQQNTAHLHSLGARPMSRADFAAELPSACAAAPIQWRFDPVYWSDILTRHEPSP